MDDRRVLTIAEPLCFTRSRLGKVPIAQIRQTLIDFYSSDQLTVAKIDLRMILRSLQLTAGHAHLVGEMETTARNMKWMTSYRCLHLSMRRC